MLELKNVCKTFYAGTAGFCVNNADEIALVVKETTAGIAGIDSRAGLEKGHGFAFDFDFTSERTDNAAGNGAAELS